MVIFRHFPRPYLAEVGLQGWYSGVLAEINTDVANPNKATLGGHATSMNSTKSKFRQVHTLTSFERLQRNIDVSSRRRALANGG